MMSALQMIYASRMKRTDIISYCESNISLKNAPFNDKIYSKEGAFMSENKLLAEIDV